MKTLFFLIAIIGLNISSYSQTTYTGIFRSPSNNTTYHHLIRDNSAGAALYVNQVNAQPSSRILQLSSGTSQAAQGVKFTVLSDGRVGILTSNPDAELTVKGDVHAQEVKVDLNGAVAPDYVFEREYELKSLKEIEEYIKAFKHLPEVPTAQEFEKEGINLSSFNMLLLKKIEELTLYTLEQEKKIEEKNAFFAQLEEKLVKQQEILETLLNRLHKLESE